MSETEYNPLQRVHPVMAQAVENVRRRNREEAEWRESVTIHHGLLPPGSDPHTVLTQKGGQGQWRPLDKAIQENYERALSTPGPEWRDIPLMRADRERLEKLEREGYLMVPIPEAEF